MSVPKLLLGALVAASVVACGAESSDRGGGGTGGSDAGGSGGAGGIDCSRVGCAAPPLCATGCTAACGCCNCGPNETLSVDGGTLVCVGGCYAPGDGG